MCKVRYQEVDYGTILLLIMIIMNGPGVGVERMTVLLQNVSSEAL